MPRSGAAEIRSRLSRGVDIVIAMPTAGARCCPHTGQRHHMGPVTCVQLAYPFRAVGPRPAGEHRSVTCLPVLRGQLRDTHLEAALIRIARLNQVKSVAVGLHCARCVAARK